MLFSEKLEYLSFCQQLIIGLQQRFCPHNWCKHFNVISTDNIGGHFGFNHEYCPKCGKVRA